MPKSITKLTFYLVDNMGESSGTFIVTLVDVEFDKFRVCKSMKIVA